MKPGNNKSVLWSIVLAGGEGTRVGSFVQRWLGKQRPKQFCTFVGTRSLLQHTLDRAARLAPVERSVLVVARTHREEAMAQLDGRGVGTLLFQPANRDTAAGVFLSLTYIRARDPHATVVIYSSDHFVYPEEKFLDTVRAAVLAAERLQDRIVLLGVALDSWRWEGVPFFIRAGKHLPVTATEVFVTLKRPPQNVFGETFKEPRNYVRFRLGPDRVAEAIGARAKVPGDKMIGDETELFVCHQRGDEMEAYERLIGDAMLGDPSLFARQDGVEASWRVVDPVLRMPTPVYEYEPGTWGPYESHTLIAPFGGWQSPKEQA